MDCNFPKHIKPGGVGMPMAVPCGKCIACRIARVRDWSVRLSDESSRWEYSSFITLTYSDDYLPVTNCGKATLIKKDLQDFFKRFRKSLPYPIKYFACGEYGTSNPVLPRPHYHAIVFGLDPSDAEIVRREWPQGFVVVEPVNIERIKYVCGYVEKKMFYNPKDNFTKGYGCLVPPFQLMSRGLGLAHFDEHFDQYVTTLRKTVNGVSYSFPRYYVKKHPEFKEALKVKSDFNSMLAFEKRNAAIKAGYDLEASRLQRDHDLKAKSKLKRGVL